MPSRNRLKLLLLLPLFISLACQAVTGLWEAQPSALPTTPTLASLLVKITPKPSQTSKSTLPPTPTLRPTATTSATPTPSYTPTETPLSPTPTQTSAPLPTLSALQMPVFEQLWGIVNDNYLYPDFNGLDWDAVYLEYRNQIQAGVSDQEFYEAMGEMIYRLNDEHSIFFNPQEAADINAGFSGNFEYEGIGIITYPIPERERIVVILVIPGSPADQAGLRTHDSILLVDGQPILDEDGFNPEVLLGPVGSTLELTVQSPGQESRKIVLTRQRVASYLTIPYEVLTSPGGKRIGYIFLPTFGDINVDESVRRALVDLTANGELDGLIIDNRYNNGGSSDEFLNTSGYFIDGVLGNIISRQDTRPLQVVGIDINGSKNVPLIVLVGKGTISFGEIFAGILKDLGRAYLIGEVSDGNVEILDIHTFVDGSLAWIAQSRFQPLNHPEQDWEQTGIIPDLIIPVNWDEVTLESDPAVQAALEYFDR